MASSKVPALRLTLGGAPNTWHTVDGLPGHFHPQIPAPVGGPGECPLEAAQLYADMPGAPVELCDLAPAQAQETRELLERLRQEARRALTVARQQGKDSPLHTDAEHAALVGEKE
jgi:hypothetical protein